MKKVVYGQDEAIESIVDKILVSQAGLKPDDKPIGAFVFMGPTGTGKTTYFILYLSINSSTIGFFGDPYTIPIFSPKSKFLNI